MAVNETIDSELFDDANRALHFPIRLEVARCISDLQNKELAEDSGVGPRAVSNWKRGVVPHGSSLRGLAGATGFPEHYFMKSTPPPTVDRLNYFVRTATPNYVRDRFTAYGSLVGEIVESVRDYLPELSPALMWSPTTRAADHVAIEMRLRLGLAEEQTIDSIVALLERSGVLVVNGPDERKQVDGYSAWISDRPVIVLNPHRGELLRSRKTIAHELGHLVMHDGVAGKTAKVVQQREKEADRFARSFLIPPAPAFRRRVQQAVRTYGWVALEGVQANTGISVTEILTYALHLGLEDMQFIEKRAIAWSADHSTSHRHGAGTGFVERPSALREAVNRAAEDRRSTPELLAREAGIPTKFMLRMIE